MRGGVAIWRSGDRLRLLLYIPKVYTGAACPAAWLSGIAPPTPLSRQED